MTERTVERAGREGGGERAVAAEPAHVVVVVLNWKGYDDTAACLRTLAASDWPRTTVLLVDNGSPDGSGERLHRDFPDVPYLQTGANLGYTGGNNRGFAWALDRGADHVVVLNNDTEVAPDCVRRLVEAAGSDPRVGLVAPKILVHDAPDTLWFAGGDLALARGTGRHRGEGARDAEYPQGSRAGEITFATGCCFLLTRPALEAVGGFDDAFFAYNEDVDLSWRLARAGFALRYEPAARLTHKVPPLSAEPSPFQIVQRDRNRRRFVRLRLGAARRAQFAAWFYATRAVHLARYLARGDRARALAIVKGAAT
ncbi:glycosyltransferase family 2 protein [Roseisolibacter sp. H3M3-2]|uniref:glycosyltransferase family 2 protein n=1 Tax=Roseisolibacter sp. H3M3-2 TaxID=3031323 RepID=UPI0023DC3C81|nr:glycosyltransferase family 2 protein [Roseisolibacter sp. H3M3-2]MDF1505315.1 glycosyltransferase family 2 protein [Roseisolibacter sp. H3M3-2]